MTLTIGDNQMTILNILSVVNKSTLKRFLETTSILNYT